MHIDPPRGVQGGPVEDDLTTYKVKFRVLEEKSPFYGTFVTVIGLGG